MEFLDKTIPGDCEQILSGLTESIVDLILISPPFAD